ncbi:ATP-binding cassette glutathione S-conjugate transporter ycf1 [Coemansia sp. BCRC 34962]|nr:ATP-binding cassette glutathione S-conjugate transporter ycf1 [Coemansia sp. BCRC 34962]
MNAMRAFASDLLLCSGLRLLVYINDVTLPILVARMLGELHVNTFSMANALFALVLYGGFSVWATAVEQNQIDLRDRVKLKIRLTLTAAIHQSKLRKGTPTNADMYSCGIRDTQQLATHIVSLTGAIWLPVRVFGGLYVFYQQVGWAVIPGIAITMVYLPLRKHLVRHSTRAHTLATEAGSQRVQKLTQLVENIVPLRILGWDRLLARGIQSVREKEELLHTTNANTTASLLAFARTVCRSGGPLASLFLYSAYSLASTSRLFVTAEQVYLVQAILRELFPLLIDVPHAFDSWWAARRPYEQIEQQLLSESPLEPVPTSTTIQIANGSFTWSATGQVLSIPKLLVEQGQLIAVVGRVGAGKSSLLLALLGEMHQASGQFHMNHKHAYVSQVPWLMSTTIRDNILFGLPFNETWYTTVINVCELSHDLDQMPHGDHTTVGNSGMVLSGGQRMRVALARAVYARPDVLLLDDILASVDAHVGKRLVGRVLSPMGVLPDTARIVVTQSPSVLAIAHGICVVSHGRVCSPQPLAELLSDMDFLGAIGGTTSSSLPPVFSEPAPLATPPNSGSLRPAAIDKAHELVVAPKRQPANQWQQYLVPVRYMWRICGGPVIALHCATVAMQCIASRNAQLWLAKPVPLNHDTEAWHPTLSHFAMCMIWWAADVTLELGGQYCTEVIWRQLMFVKSHSELLSSTISAPLSFFSSRPLGRILSLFTESQQDVDTRMPQRLANLSAFAVKLAFESWIILEFHPALIVSLLIVIAIMRFIVTVSRGPLAVYLAAQTEALPMIDEEYQDTLTGAQTVRAFGAHDYAKLRLSSRLSAFASAQRAGDCVETWIDMTMSLLRCLVTSIAFAIALLSAANNVEIDPTFMSLVYWSITFLLARIQHLVRHSHALHSSLERASRFIEFTLMDSESDQHRTKSGAIPAQWPTAGAIEFRNVSARYESEWVLDRMSFTTGAGRHVGVVGRTGAGKTSIVMALLGSLHPESGTITIDGIDTSTVPLDLLRERLAVVPQSVAVLQGSLRFNIDPRSEYSDTEIISVLDSVGLSAASLDDTGLSAWSLGQRQLLS